jgi:sec-independent protein translocase protein TatA
MFGIVPIGPWEIVLILAIVLIIFGAGKLPEVAKMFGKSVKEFKGAVKDAEDHKQS